MIDKDNIIPSTMTNFENNFKNYEQKKNTNKFNTALNQREIQFTLERQEGYNFFSVFELLDYEFAINPDGSMTIMDWAATVDKDVDSVEEMIEFIEEKLK